MPGFRYDPKEPGQKKAPASLKCSLQLEVARPLRDSLGEKRVLPLFSPTAASVSRFGSVVTFRKKKSSVRRHLSVKTDLCKKNKSSAP